ncbi:ATP-dependent DNA/RNA helicase DHX36-like [Ischnura elegans]|uniref:ATP-dependent DNA/RNA helicase DHX36-like n=1 Tax=Ischnura elegans TaxID=197161 RepID=UPI001ED89C5F|nr:ATP-dependent DNA/RNA helicase DHX36-like [Ischnura elegans]
MHGRRNWSRGSSRGFRRGGRDHSGERSYGREDDDSGPRGRGRRGRGIPPGLRGKEIGLYFARRSMNQRNAEKTYVCVDQKEREKITELLGKVEAGRPSTSSHLKEEARGEEEEGEATRDHWWMGEDERSEQDDKQSMPPPKDAEKKYGHIRDSAFKRGLIANIQRNLEAERGVDEAISSVPVKNEKLDLELKDELMSKMESDSRYLDMIKFRKKLPSFEMRDQILDLINKNQVVVVSGETGCGKTTQVAQFVLDQEILSGHGSTCRVICTQPRRISAISVAERVADERGERCGSGGSVGYQIRLEKKMPRNRGSILFCTTGVLLEWMKSDQSLASVSHLILDEIHERDVHSDFVIAILKGVMPKRPDLKLVLMSATLNADKFSKYYDNCPFINIPGFTYPVKEYYLEDVLEITRFTIEEGRASREVEGWQKHLKHNKAKIAKNQEFRDWINPHIRQLAYEGRYSKNVLDSLALPESEELNIDLIALLIQHICLNNEDGAILVFLPGWSEISTLHNRLTDSGNFPRSRYIIIPLHSMMPTVNQREIFNRPPPGVRKIIIATSIAETSITIDDVVFVVDCGKTKMKNFDVKNNIATLEPQWVSLANAHQRRGRAGRVQPGICYHLYSRAREMMLDQYPLPEMLRSRLEEVILQLKVLHLGKVRPFLSKVMDPPDPRAIDLSLRLLHTLNALDEDEHLTPLGFHLAHLPIDPQTGKMILLAAIFSCVDPILSVAASLGFKDAFIIPLGKEREVDAKKRQLSQGSKSDHLVLAEALKRWEQLDAQGGERGRRFCWEYFLSSHTLNLLRNMKGQFAEHLHRMKFLNSGDYKAKEANVNSNNRSLVKAIICAGLYPHVATVRAVGRNKGGLRVRTAEDGRVCIHPKSVNEKEREFESPFLVYHLKLRSTAIFLHDTTIAHPLPLLFFGEGPVRWQLDDRGFGIISINETIRFNCRKDTSDLIKKLRQWLDNLLEEKITHPGVTNWDSNSEEGKVLRSIVDLITSEDKTCQKRRPESDEDGRDDSDY